MIKRWAVRAALILVAALALAACDDETISVSENKQASRSETQTISIDTSQALELAVRNNVGKITVRPGSADEIIVESTFTAFGETVEEAETELADMAIVVQQTNIQTVINGVQTRHTDEARANTVDMVITVPPSLRLDVNNNVGDISIEDLDLSRARITNNVGKVLMVGIDVTTALSVTTDVGDVQFEGAIGETGTYKLETNVGAVTVTLPAATAARFEASSNVGDITVTDLEMDDVEQTTEGPIDRYAGQMNGGEANVILLTNVGDITIQAG
jgi:hypothetical protein